MSSAVRWARQTDGWGLVTPPARVGACRRSRIRRCGGYRNTGSDCRDRQRSAEQGCRPQNDRAISTRLRVCAELLIVQWSVS